MSSAVDIPALKGGATKAGNTASKRAATGKEQSKGTLPRPPAIDTQAKPAAARTATTFSGSDRYSTNSNDMSDFSHQMSPQMSSVTSEARQRHNNELLRTPPAKGRLVARHHSDALAGPTQDGQGSGIEEMRPPRLDVSVMHTGIAPSRHRMTGLGSVVDAYSTTSRGHFMTEDQEFASLGLGLIGERTPPHLAMTFDRSPQSFFATTPQRQIRDLGEGPALRPMSTIHGTTRPSGGTPSNFWDMLQTPSAYAGVHGLQSPARAGAAAVDMQAQYALNGSGSTNAADVPSAQTTGTDDDQMRNSRDVAQKLSFTTPLSARNKGSRRTLAQQPTIPEEGEQSDDNAQATAQAPESTGRSKRKRRAPRRPGDDSDADSVSGGRNGPGATTEGSPKRQKGGARRGKGVQGANSKSSKGENSSSSSDVKEELENKLVVETGTANSALWAIPNGITSPQMTAFSPGWPRLGLDSATSFAGFGGLTEPHGAMPAMPGTPDRAAGETDHVQRLASHMFSPNMAGRTAVASTPSYGMYVPGLSPAGHMAATSSSQFFMPTYGQFTAYPQAFMGMPGGAPTYGGIPPMDVGMMKGMANGAMMYPQMYPNMQPQAVFGHRSPDQVAQNSAATAAATSQITRNMPGARSANSQSANRPLAQQHPHRSPDNPTPGSTRTYHQSQNPSPNVKTPMSQPGSGRKSGCTTEGAKQLKQGLGRLFDAYDFGQDGTIAESDLLTLLATHGSNLARADTEVGEQLKAAATRYLSDTVINGVATRAITKDDFARAYQICNRCSKLREKRQDNTSPASNHNSASAKNVVDEVLVRTMPEDFEGKEVKACEHFQWIWCEGYDITGNPKCKGSHRHQPCPKYLAKCTFWKHKKPPDAKQLAAANAAASGKMKRKKNIGMSPHVSQHHASMAMGGGASNLPQLMPQHQRGQVMNAAMR